MGEKKKHILEQVKDRYEQFKDTTFISNEEQFEDFIKERCPNFAHRGPREYPVLVEAISMGSGKRHVIGYTYMSQVQQYIFDRKLS